MKESGKLIELLDEYDSVQYHKINHKIENGEIYRNVGGTDGWHQVWRYCKQFGFIKRLVENDKINHHKISDIMIYSQWRYTGVNKTTAQRVDENFLDLLLMILSIQDNPIEFLCSVLK